MTQKSQEYPNVVMDSSNYFIVTWQSNNDSDGDESWGVRAKVFKNNDNNLPDVIYPEFQVNIVTLYDQTLP